MTEEEFALEYRNVNVRHHWRESPKKDVRKPRKAKRSIKNDLSKM